MQGKTIDQILQENDAKIKKMPYEISILDKSKPSNLGFVVSFILTILFTFLNIIIQNLF